MTRTFTNQQLLDWGLHENDDCKHVVRFQELHSAGWNTLYELVFRAPDDGKLYRLEVEYNNEAGYHDLEDRDANGAWVAPEVELRRKMIEVEVYEPVEDPPGFD